MIEKEKLSKLFYNKTNILCFNCIHYEFDEIPICKSNNSIDNTIHLKKCPYYKEK